MVDTIIEFDLRNVVCVDEFWIVSFN